MLNLYGITLSKLEALMLEQGQSKFRAKQLYTWIYEKEEIDFDNMSDISKSFRDVLKQSKSLINSTVSNAIAVLNFVESTNSEFIINSFGFYQKTYFPITLQLW